MGVGGWGLVRKGNRTAQGLGGHDGVEGGQEEVPGQSGEPQGQKRVQCGQMESTSDPGQTGSPERDSWNPPTPERKPLFWGGLRPKPGSSAAYIHGVF